MNVSLRDVRHALDELGRLRFGEMRVEEALEQIVKVTHTISNHFEPRRFGRAVRVLVHINRGSQKITADLGNEDAVKYTIPFRTTRVRDIKIEMLDREKGTHHTAAGFAEIELFMESRK